MEQINHHTTQTTGEAASLTMEYVLSRIDQILQDNKHIQTAIEAIAGLEPMEQSSLSQMPDSRGEAIAQAVSAREETNRKMLDILREMYQDLSPVSAKDSETVQKLDKLTEVITSLDIDEEYINEMMSSLIDRVFPK